MNKTTRMLAMSGIAIAAGLTMGVGPASAAPAAPATPATAAAKADHKVQPSRDKVVGYYKTASQCIRFGKVGEFRKKWDDFDCSRVRRGFHRGHWELTAKWDRFGHGLPMGHGRPAGHGQPMGHGAPRR